MGEHVEVQPRVRRPGAAAEFENGLGPWMLTLSGKRLSVLSPSPADICIGDVAHGLALENRFGGQLSGPYSVAQHSILVTSIVNSLVPAAPPSLLQRALLHDAAEGLGLRDMPSPYKVMLPDYRELEARLMEAVCFRFEVPMVAPAVIKEADSIAFATERRDLFRAEERRLPALYPAAPGKLVAVPWRQAKATFLALWEALELRRREVEGGSLRAG